MTNIKMTIEYEGTRYQGWQRTDKKDSSATISGKLSETLSRILEENVEPNCAVRTESGVHAAKQVINFKTNSSMSPAQIMEELNLYLPKDIAVLSAEPEDERFHAALGCRGAVYLYRIQAGPYLDVFHRAVEYHLPELPDAALMQTAADQILGKHDFIHLSSGKKKKGTIRTLENIVVSCPDDSHLEIEMTADTFLHQMPRLITAALLEIGLGDQPADYLQKILDGTEKAPAPVSPLGLTLIDVCY